MEPVKNLLRMPTETTDLERRVLAHERVLQALIAYMARTEPHFIDHLKERFVEPMCMERHEQDFRDTEDYAAEFIQVIIRLEEVRARQPVEPKAKPEQTRVPFSNQEPNTGEARPQPNGVRICERNGIWSVTTGGEFYGDYSQEEHALAAAALLNMARQ